ncbi:MFS transporter [Microlunatus sp. Gsoil 973]|uniref:MFS transporter n=1 Tax=Microlunatus sp. Gsoil 973 TaxID=2672569 RepID=UPI0012B472D3|nr:MFS transporter [Microlunatus sp. Gsoil 973]QGN33234.1 MFS transporter [Microlunatus sp. Gsoil 973]
MPNQAPTRTRAIRRATLRSAFVPAATALVAAFVATAAPIPLFNTYRAEDNFSNADIAITVVAYSVGTVAALLVLGRLSNHLGRRRTAFMALALLLVGCLLLLDVHHIGALVIARLLTGLGVGLASSGLTSYLVDAAPGKPAWLASVAASQAPMLGLTLGAIGSGALVQFGPSPRELIYLAVGALLLLSALLILISPETAQATPGAWRALLPRVHLPVRARHLLPVAAAVFVVTWSTGAFYQAFVPALIDDQLHNHSTLVLALVFSAYMAPSVLGAPLSGRFSPATAQRIGMIVFGTGMVGIVASIAADTLALFIAASVIGGVGQGIAISSAIRGLLHGSVPADRAPIFATVYLLDYGGAAIISLVAGQLSNTFSLPQIAFAYGGLAVIATVFTVLAAKNPHTVADAKTVTRV